MNRTIRFDVLTLFPGIFDGYVRQSLLEDAIQAGLVQVHAWNMRDWTQDKHQRVDDRPFGGGPGMVLMAQPVIDCVQAVQQKADLPGRVVMLTPAGERLTQRTVEKLAQEPRLVLLCGRYEGFDDRIRHMLNPLEISVGDFVCNGGEVPAMVLIDTVIRLIPGVLGHEQSAADESHSEDGRIEYPQYTRPRVFNGLEVPEILLSGNHQAVAKWRREQSELRSRKDSTPRIADPRAGGSESTGRDAGAAQNKPS
ncbi:tRNA (guanine-N(1)-)-methyltransferase [Gemmata sp. SH-PL17]|nr:tRNA (guanosine(37)-N1)-methyltransferase TrmD [Gemmata sp. SH-PL17]AMV25680.1 tRNA (guanine-N(1)-)-methyltransferase [Gemmata sp. SH-PL17]